MLANLSCCCRAECPLVPLLAPTPEAVVVVVVVVVVVEDEPRFNCEEANESDKVELVEEAELDDELEDDELQDEEEVEEQVELVEEALDEEVLRSRHWLIQEANAPCGSVAVAAVSAD